MSMMALAPVSVPSLPKSHDAQDPTAPTPGRGEPSPFLLHGTLQRAKVCWTVRAPPACQHGRSLGSMLEGLATACGYGDPERQPLDHCEAL